MNEVSSRVRRLTVAVLLLSAWLFSSAAANKLGQSCVANRNCDAGLHCETCIANGNLRSRCTRIQPLSPTSKVKGLPFNRYSWLTTHNSFAILGQKSALGIDPVSPKNQQDSVTEQLNNGVRGLMLDMYDFLNDIWLCHSFGGQCYNATAFQPAINVLKEIEAFLAANPSEIITIFIEDYVTSPQGLTKVFDAAGLRKYWFPVSRMPKNGGDWPVIDDMVQKNQRLLVFTSKRAKEASERIAFQWTYTAENQYGNGGQKTGSCPKRAESPAMTSTGVSLIVQNFFPDNPDLANACRDNSAPLMNMVKTCHDASGKRWPNFIAVDFYKRSDRVGSPGAVDMINGQSLCGCNSISYCRANATYGTCDVPEAAPAPADGPSGPAGTSRPPPSAQDSGAPFSVAITLWSMLVQASSAAVLMLL